MSKISYIEKYLSCRYVFYYKTQKTNKIIMAVGELIAVENDIDNETTQYIFLTPKGDTVKRSYGEFFSLHEQSQAEKKWLDYTYRLLNEKRKNSKSPILKGDFNILYGEEK